MNLGEIFQGVKWRGANVGIMVARKLPSNTRKSYLDTGGT